MKRKVAFDLMSAGFESITQLMAVTFETHLLIDQPDAVLNIESHLYDRVLRSNTCVFDFDLGTHLWLNRQRWSRLVREYVPLEGVERFIAQSKEIYGGEARKGATTNMLFRDPDRHAKKHRWGGCLMGATFRGSVDDRPTLTLYSRTTYNGYMAFLDAAIAARIAARIADPKTIRFRWHVSSLQLHSFKSLPYVYSQPNLKAMLDPLARSRSILESRRDKTPPTLYHMAKWQNKILEAYDQHGVNMLDHEKYGPFRRIKRRWLEHKGLLTKNLPPSCPIKTLTFEKAV